MALLHRFNAYSSSLPLGVSVLILALLMGLSYIIWILCYNLLISPLRRFPGPKLWAISSIPHTLLMTSGNGPQQIARLHKKYGPIIRVSPDTLSFNHPDAMKEIRGHRKTGTAENEKEPQYYSPQNQHIIGADRANHARYRRALAHGFSAQAMLEQQPVIQSYVDTFIQKLSQESGSKPLEMVSWFNWTTFDIIGDLAFGESFGCLENTDYHPWVSMIFATLKHIAWMRTAIFLPSLRHFIKPFIPKDNARKWREHNELSREKVRKRLESGTERPDLMYAMSNKSAAAGNPMTFDELAEHASVLIIAGSETTATVLSATLYYLTSHPETLAQLTNEVREAFATEEEVNLLSVQKLSYMLAVLEESLRLYPPVPTGSPRIIGKGGDTIVGEYLPQGTVVESWQWAIYHNPDHFAQPDEFIPERWLGDPRFANDARQSLQPFSIGPRNCIGKNLAYAEMRLILAKLVWNFDVQLAEDSQGWDKRSKVYTLWEKPALNVYLTPRKVE